MMANGDENRASSGISNPKNITSELNETASEAEDEGGFIEKDKHAPAKNRTNNGETETVRKRHTTEPKTHHSSRITIEELEHQTQEEEESRDIKI